MPAHRVPRRIVLLLALAAPLLGCGGGDTAAPPPAPEVTVTEVVVRDVPIVNEWVGETRGQSDIEIRARVQGYLTKIHFVEGARVEKGQLLYTIDKSELLQDVAASKAQLAAARTALAYAETDVSRYQPLAEINAVSRRDLDSAIARRDAAASQVEAAEALLTLAEINLSYADVKSPVSGIIGLSKAKVGDYVGQSPNPVVLNTVSKTDPIHVRFPIGEQEYLELARSLPRAEDRRVEKEAAVKVPLQLVLADGTIHPYEGHVVYVERAIDASTGTLMIEAAFPNPELVLRPGQYGRIRAVVNVLHDARLVPQRAVQELQGQFQVWIVEDDDTVEPRKIETGRRVDRMWVVRDGLSPGERIVVDGIQRLRSGMKVRSEPWVAPPTAAEAVAGS